MNILVPYDDTAQARSALRTACRMAKPCDAVILVATIAVPRGLPLTVPVGYVWKQSCQVERCLLHARREIEQSGVAARCVRVRARNRADAIIAAATNYRADSVIFAVSGHLFSLLAMRFGTISTVALHVPCAVRVIIETAPEMPRHDEWNADSTTAHNGTSFPFIVRGDQHAV